MKVQALLTIAAALHASAAAIASSNDVVSEQEIIESLLSNPYLLPSSTYRMLSEEAHGLSKREAQGGGAGGLGGLLGQLLGGGGGGASSSSNRNAPNSTVPEIQKEKAIAWPEAKRVKIRYGPYRIPPTSEKNTESEVLNVQGMSNTFKVNATKPCTGDCTLLSMFANLEYADGSPANNSNGAWFHHTVLLNSGPLINDPNCGTSRIENIFMSGNERSNGGFAMPGASIKSGYALSQKDNFILTTELMNMDNKEKWTWLTITYEYLEGAHPDYKQGKTVWMSLGGGAGGGGGGIGAIGCSNVPKVNMTQLWGPSNLTATQQPKSLVFSEHSKPWIAPKDGWILSTGGHMHDGGTGVEIFKNKERICDSIPHYAKTVGGDGMGMRKRQIPGGKTPNSDIEHIQRQDSCRFVDGLPVKKGDTMHLQANYDFNAHQGMKNKKGDLDEVMGIVGTLVVF